MISVKRTISIILCISLFLCLLSSCALSDSAGAESTTPVATENSGTTQETTTEAETETTTEAPTAPTTKAETTSQTAKTSAQAQKKSASTSKKTASASSVKNTTSSTTKKKTTTTTTKKKTTTTKKTAISTKPRSGSPYKEISPSSVKNHGIGTVVRAWSASKNGVSVEIQKIQYGSKITQNFRRAMADPGMDVSSKTVTYQPYCNVAIINCSPERLKVATSQQLFGKKTSDVQPMAKKVGALVAVNNESIGDYPGTHARVRNGKRYGTSDGSTSRILQMYRDGTWKRGNVSSANVNSLINQGLYNTIRYQSDIIWDGKIEATAEKGNYYHNTVIIGKIDSTHYVFAVGEFMPKKDVAKILQSFGVKYAIAQNGGNCSFLYGDRIGNTTGSKATKIKDIDKVNVLETEFFAAHGMLGKNSKGQQKLGGPCSEPDILYVA